MSNFRNFNILMLQKAFMGKRKWNRLDKELCMTYQLKFYLKFITADGNFINFQCHKLLLFLRHDISEVKCGNKCEPHSKKEQRETAWN